MVCSSSKNDELMLFRSFFGLFRSSFSFFCFRFAVQTSAFDRCIAVMGRVSRYKKEKKVPNVRALDKKNSKINLPLGEDEANFIPKRARWIMEMQNRIEQDGILQHTMKH